jgi:hypothetical protein
MPLDFMGSPSILVKLDGPKWRNWQTRMVQGHVPARVWGFKSPLRHHKSLIKHRGECTRQTGISSGVFQEYRSLASRSMVHTVTGCSRPATRTSPRRVR